jgi:HPt (histidine-containing phosphotransfer) domain-containing protein
MNTTHNDLLPLIDLKVLGRLTEELDPRGDKQLRERVLLTFQTSGARLLVQAQEALPAGDLATVGRVIHTLKSSSASIGAMRLSQQCTLLEEALGVAEGLHFAHEEALHQELKTQPSNLHAQNADAIKTLGVVLQATSSTIQSLLQERA